MFPSPSDEQVQDVGVVPLVWKKNMNSVSMLSIEAALKQSAAEIILQVELVNQKAYSWQPRANN